MVVAVMCAWSGYADFYANVWVVADPANAGSCSGGGFQAVGSSQQIGAYANDGWIFARWDDGNTSNVRYVTIPDVISIVYTAYFSPASLVTVRANPVNGGSVGGGGTYVTGSSRTVTATANSGYTFANWTEGGTVVNSSASYTFTLTGNRALVANFTPIPQPILSATPADRPVSANAGSTTFIVINTGNGTMNWTASVSSGGSWARITSGASGVNAGTVTVGYDGNPSGGAARTCTVQVVASGASGSPQNVTVSQVANSGTGGSALSASQRCYFTYSGNSYFALVYDYSAGLQESATAGFISNNTYLTFTAQSPSPSMTTHVGYVYNTNVGRYTEAMAFLGQSL